MDQTTSAEKLLRQVDRNALRRLLRSQNDDKDEGSDKEDIHASPESPHRQGPAHSPHQIPVKRSSVWDTNEWSDEEEQLQASSGQNQVDTDVEAQDNTCAQATSDIVQQPNVLTTAKGDNLLKHDMDFQQNVTADHTSRDLIHDVDSTTTDTTTTDDGEKDLGRDIPSQKGMGDLQSLPLPADEVGEGTTNVQMRKREQEDSSDAEGCKQLDRPLPLSPEPSSDTGHAFSTSGDDQGVRTARSLATVRMEAGQKEETSEDLEVSATDQPDSANTSTTSTVEWEFYEGRPSFAARVDSLPFSNQEHNIIRQLHGQLAVFSPLIIVGDEGCGKTTAALMLARHMMATGEIGATYWYDSDHVSSCWLPSMTTSSLLVIDDFLGHCPSESFTRWRSLCQFFFATSVRTNEHIDIILTSRTSVLRQFQASCGAEFSALFSETQIVTMSMDYSQVWQSAKPGIEAKTPNFDRPPSIGFPLCCKLLPCLSQSVWKILFKQPRCALRNALVEVMNVTSVARTALALLAVTDGYLDTSVLMDPEKLQASQHWKPLNYLEEQPLDGSRARALMSFYEDSCAFILLEDEFASFVNEAVRESVLVVLCESHAEFLSEFCSLKLLSQIALVTSDVRVESNRTEKPVLSECAKSAFLRRMITELELGNYHGVFTCSLLTHASFQEKLAEKIKQDLITTLLDTRDQKGLHFLFYAGAIDSPFEDILPPPAERDERMVMQALLACCFWNRAHEIDGLWTNFKKDKGLKKALKTATIQGILTGDLRGFPREEAPLWMEVPMHAEDTLVTMAAWRGNDAVVQNLASKGMNLSSQGSNGWTALMHYCARGSSKMTSFLLRKKADPLVADARGTTALMHAMNRKEWDIPQELINLENSQETNNHQESALSFACANGWSVHRIRSILSLGDGVISKDNCGCNCLHYACLNGHTDVVEYLLKNRNIDVGQETDYGFTPLDLALMSPDRSKLISLLLKYHAGKNANVEKILITICMYSGRKILEQFLSGHPADDLAKFRALEKACLFGNADIVRYLLHRGANKNLLGDGKSFTCLHVACAGVSLETVEMLATEMDINVKTASGTTPIMIALQHGRLEFVQLLHSRGASLNVKDDIGSCLHHAVKSQSIRVLEWCVNEQHMDINDRNKKNQTPLFLASSGGRTRSMKWLLDHRADVTATDKDGNSCLHAAAQSGCLLALEILLSKMSPGQLNVPNNSGKTPLQLARESGHNHVVNYLGGFHLADLEREMDST